jgi:3-phosphoglycerate kinase
VEYIDRLVEVPGPERIVEIEKPVEIIKEVLGPERIVQVEVPVERIVEKQVVVENLDRVNDLTEDNKKLKKRVIELEKLVNKQPEVVEKIVEVAVEVPVEIEKAATGDLKHAARLLAQSEFNKEDLTVDQIFEILQKSSEEEVRRKIGFWAVPLPKQDPSNTTDKRYIGKK